MCYINYMEIEFDPNKNEWNIHERGLSFDMTRELDWDNAIYSPDDRKGYGETRVRALLKDAEGKPYIVAYTQKGNVRRIISFRRAHEKERKRYEKT